MPLKVANKEALAELYNVLLAVENEGFPDGIRLGRHGSTRDLWFLYKEQPHIFFMAGPRGEESQNTLIIPDEMMELKENRGMAFKNLIRTYVRILKEALDDFESNSSADTSATAGTGSGG